MSESGVDTEGLIEYFRSRTKDSLRGVYTYDENAHVSTHYIRDDIAEECELESIKAMLRKMFTVEVALRNVEEEGVSPFIGNPRASLHTFDDVVIVQLIGTSIERGVLASFDKDIAARHTRFVDEALARWLKRD